MPYIFLFLFMLKRNIIKSCGSYDEYILQIIFLNFPSSSKFIKLSLLFSLHLSGYNLIICFRTSMSYECYCRYSLIALLWTTNYKRFPPFIGPESNHWLCLSLTDSKLVEVVTVAD